MKLWGKGARMATIYYAVTVDGNAWGRTGELNIEPIKVEGREPLGREPDLCCDSMREAYPHRDESGWQSGILHRSRDSYDQGPMALAFRAGGPSTYLSDPESIINFCPWCGARIVFVEDLHLRVKAVEKTEPARTYTAHHYELA